MDLVLFSLCASVALAGALAVIFTPSPVVSALGLVMTMFAISALYFLLGAVFVGVVQIIVYAGAIVVLFLFVIMLLDVGDRQVLRERFTKYTWLGVAVGLIFVGIAGFSVWSVIDLPSSPPVAAADEGHTRHLARQLFQHHLFSFEIISVILLAGLVGVTLLIRFHAPARFAREED